MKKHLRLLIPFLLVIFAQTTMAQERTNNIEIADLQISQPTQKGIIGIGAPEADVIKAFGKPVKDEPYYFEMDDKNGTVLTYKGGKLYFLANKLESFDIDGDNFLIGLKDHGVYMYTSIGKTTTAFKTIQYRNGAAFFNIQHNGSNIDEILSFALDSNKNVTRIIYTKYDSSEAE